MKKMAILSTRTARYHPNGRMLEAARHLGHEAFLLHPLKAGAHVSGFAKRAITEDTKRPDVVLPRIGSTINDTELAAVFHLERLGIPMVNGFDSLVVGRDKFLSLRVLDTEGVPAPRTFLATDASRIESAVEQCGGFPVVMKSARGRQGTTVHLVKDMDPARYIFDHPPREGDAVLIQEYIPSAVEGDVRIVVIGGKAAAWMKRVPKKGEFRSNAHLRGKGQPWEPVEDWVRTAENATKALGLHVAGVDLLEGPDGPIVLEVNTTPGFRELERVCGCDVAVKIVGYAAGIAKGES